MFGVKSREELWNILEGLAKEEGLELFDIVWPAPRGAVLRVFVSKGRRGEGVDVEECASMSRRILAHPDVEDLLPGKCLLEVSSPGINRKLRLPRHFAGAVGERVKVTFVHSETPDHAPGRPASKRTVTGLLTSCDGKCLEVEEEKSTQKWEIPLGEVSEARVDFLFS